MTRDHSERSAYQAMSASARQGWSNDQRAKADAGCEYRPKLAASPDAASSPPSTSGGVESRHAPDDPADQLNARAIRGSSLAQSGMEPEGVCQIGGKESWRRVSHDPDATYVAGVATGPLTLQRANPVGENSAPHAPRSRDACRVRSPLARAWRWLRLWSYWR